MKRPLLVVLYLLAWSSTASALEHAPVDAHDGFAVAIVTHGAPSQSPASCSGVLIAANVVLTARHCFVGIEPADRPVDCATSRFGPRRTPLEDIWVTTSTQVESKSGWHRVNAVHVPADSSVCGADIAVVVLADRVAPIEAEPASPTPAWEPSFFAIGHGATSGAGEDVGTRRRLAFSIRDQDTHEIRATDGACTGDSGSGAFDATLETPRVFGVLSRMRVERGRCRDAIYERLEPHWELVRAVTTEAARASGVPAPTWARSPLAHRESESEPREMQGASCGVRRSTVNDGVACAITLVALMGRRWRRSSFRSERGSAGLRRERA